MAHSVFEGEAPPFQLKQKLGKPPDHTAKSDAKRILVAEDDAVLRELIVETVRRLAGPRSG